MEDSAATRRLVAELLRACRCPIVLDAGAMARGHLSRKHAFPVLLTPHLGEMSALTGDDKDEIAAHQSDAARTFARAYRVSIALKGSATVICDAQGMCWVNRRGDEGLGTSGSGDVLAGVVAGLLARGAEPAQALAWGVWAHGEAGRRLSRTV